MDEQQQPIVMQRENELSRVVVAGKRTDDGDKCTLVVIQERTSWAFYPHGFGKFGVRLPKDEAVQVARAILADADPPRNSHH